MMYYRNPDDVIIPLLGELLANTYLLYIQTQGAHWNIVGPDFPQLHTLFQTQYEELNAAIDVIAEQIRICGAISPATATEFLEIATLSELPPTEDMPTLINALIHSNNICKDTAGRLAEATGGMLDVQDLAINRMAAHGKAIWMLRSTGKVAAHRYY